MLRAMRPDGVIDPRDFTRRFQAGADLDALAAEHGLTRAQAEDVLREAPALPPSLTGPDARVRVFTGDCLEVMRAIPDCTYHAIVTDPPYGLSEPLVGEDAAAVLAAWIAEGVHVRTKGRKKPSPHAARQRATASSKKVHRGSRSTAAVQTGSPSRSSRPAASGLAGP